MQTLHPRAALSANEASLLRLVSALLCEQKDEWLTSKFTST